MDGTGYLPKSLGAWLRASLISGGAVQADEIYLEDALNVIGIYRDTDTKAAYNRFVPITDFIPPPEDVVRNLVLGGMF